VADVVLQGSWQELGGRVRARAPSRLPLAARQLRHELENDGGPGRYREDPAGAYAELARRTASQRRADLGDGRRVAGTTRAEHTVRHSPCCLQVLCVRGTDGIACRLGSRPDRTGNPGLGRALLYR